MTRDKSHTWKLCQLPNVMSQFINRNHWGNGEKGTRSLSMIYDKYLQSSALLFFKISWGEKRKRSQNLHYTGSPMITSEAVTGEGPWVYFVLPLSNCLENFSSIMCVRTLLRSSSFRGVHQLHPHSAEGNPTLSSIEKHAQE